MNINNRELFLTESISMIDPMTKILIDKGLAENQVENIREILKACIEYGFNQGEIHGREIGKQLALDIIVASLMKSVPQQNEMASK